MSRPWTRTAVRHPGRHFLTGVAPARAAEAIWLLLLFVLPAAFNPGGALAVEPLKTSLLRIAAVALAAAWLADRAAPSPRVDVGAHPLVRAGIAVIGLAAVATATSIEPRLSLFGSFDRGMGWLSLAAGGVLLLTAADLFADEQRRERALTALLLGAVFPCGYFLAQRIGLDPVNWARLGAPGSSLGSPTFLGGYLVLVAPFAAYKTIRAARSGEGLVYAGWLALLLVACACVLLTTIRGPILGLGIGAAVFAILARPRRRVRVLDVAAAAGVLAVVLLLAVATAGGSGTSGLQRFTNVARLGDSSIERLMVWRFALEAPLIDPVRALVGFGPESQATVLERAEATVRFSPNEQWDRAHNLVLDTWLTGGALGVLGLLVVIGLALRTIWLGRSVTPGLLPSALLGALVGHLVEVSFAFHTVVTGALFWMLLGLAASLTPRPARILGRRSARLAGVGLVAGVLLAPLLATPAIADGLYGAARRAPYDVGAGLEELAASLAPWVEELPRAAGLDWQQVANRRNDPAALERAEADLREAANRAPLQPLPQLRLVRFYLSHVDLDAAEESCQRAMTVGPYRAAVWEACADVSGARGRTDEANIRRARGAELRHWP